ncbi:MAG: glycerol kinase [Legionellaceae bacterium]|nr:glycerol kinase [Legionellaceae bacterium]
MYFLAIDEGSSSTRAMLYDIKGRLAYTSQQSLQTNFPNPGWVEQCPEDIWNKTCCVIRDVVSNVNPKDILSCGITNQRETTVVWDKNSGKCIGPAISWQDRRTESYFNSHTDMELKLIKNKTGLIPNAYFSASKLQWLLDNEPEAKLLADKGQLAFGTIDSFLLWRLTNGSLHATDITNASRTLLYDIHNCRWDEDLLDLFAIPKSLLPEILANDSYFGEIDSNICGVKIPINAMVGDQQASLIGQACIEEGMLKATYGSGAFLLLNIGSKPVSSKHLLTTVAYSVSGKVTYGLEGCIYHAGTILKWLRNDLKILPSFADSEIYAKSVADNAGVYFLPSFTSLGAPHWITPPGAMITGLTQATTSKHIVRSALETVAFQTNDIIQCMHEDVDFPLRVLHADGGMAKNSWFLSFLSSVCNLTVKRPQEVETTALGAAMLAAVGCGFYKSFTEIHEYWKCGEAYSPAADLLDYKKYYASWTKVIDSVRKGMCV